jgi:murein DD-endopeptidase MepM/ murein hydrolase activator NlpD
VARSYTSTGGFGETVIINHGTDSVGNVVYTLYAHNRERKVFNGNSVSAGKVIALSGATGAATGPHLHYEIHVIPPGGPTPTESSFFQQEYTVDPQTFNWPALSPPN